MLEALRLAQAREQDYTCWPSTAASVNLSRPLSLSARQLNPPQSQSTAPADICGGETWIICKGQVQKHAITIPVQHPSVAMLALSLGACGQLIWALVMWQRCHTVRQPVTSACQPATPPPAPTRVIFPLTIAKAEALQRCEAGCQGRREAVQAGNQLELSQAGEHRCRHVRQQWELLFQAQPRSASCCPAPPRAAPRPAAATGRDTAG